MRLVNIDDCNRALFYKQFGGKDSLITVESAFNMLEALPTAYSVENVIEELESKICTIDEDDVEIAIRNKHFRTAIEIVKHGGVTKNCNDCANYTKSDEIDNGCYLCCKGYENNYKPKVDNDSMSDDVCEWDQCKGGVGLKEYKISCCDKTLEMPVSTAKWLKYCPYCGKKIKMVE